MKARMARARLVALALSLLMACCTGAAQAADETAAHTPPRLDLDVTLNPATRHLQAIATLTAPGDFTFVLHKSLTVEAAFADDTAVDATIRQRHGDFQQWQIPARRGARLRIRYGGTLPALDQAMNARQVLRAMPPMAATRGSFLPAGSGWYPQPAPLFTYRVRLSLPGDQRGLVAGRLVSEQLPEAAEGHYRATFDFSHPARGIALMAGPYHVRELQVPRADAPPLRLRTYFYPDLDARAEAYLQASKRYIELYAGWIGAYPFAGFSVVASPLPTGFGMPTLTYLGARVLQLPFIIRRSLGHEVLHNWWGNGVYVDYARGNWSEGLTTFMADYFYQARESDAAARKMRLGWLRNFAAIPAGEHQSLASFRSRTHGAGAAVGYDKAAMVFLMLRDAIGEDAFRRGIRLFWQRHRFEVASWDDLRRAFEETANRPLKRFFRQWIQRTGGPRVTIQRAEARAANGQTRIAVTLSQSTPPYRLHVPLRFTGAKQSATQWANVSQAQQTVTLSLDWAPESVSLDPDFRLWRVLDPSILPPILREWIIARKPRLVVVSPGSAMADAASKLAGRLFEARARKVRANEIEDETTPVLLIGRHDDIEKTLEARGWPAPPSVISGRGTAQVWTLAQKKRGAPVAVISARDAAALAALVRPLPHYGNQSYLVFDGSHALARGTWPTHVPAVPVEY